MTTPVEHVEEGLKIEAKRHVDLWEIILRGTSTHLYARYGPTVTWQSHTYENWAVQLSDEGEHADEENARPTLAVVNPDKIFGPFAAGGFLDLATVIRRRVHQEHLISNTNIYEQRIWFVGRVAGVDSQTLQLELRNANDIPSFQIPPRQYLPPEFPYVSY